MAASAILRHLEPVGEHRYRLPQRGSMQVEAWVYLSPALLRQLDDEKALSQLQDAAELPGVAHRVVGMPDIHQGYGVPIGAIVATDAEEGIVSAGAVGYDINCGVRLLSTRIPREAVDTRLLQRLVEAIERRVPTGVGRRSRHTELRPHLREIVTAGGRAAVQLGYGRPEDVERMEEGGCLPGADPAAVSQRAWERADQLATLGGGNHFIEIGTVAWTADDGTAEAFGLRRDHLYVLQHTGSRGFGHQICTDFTAAMAEAASAQRLRLPSRELACAPIRSSVGRQYLAAMACAVNFAFANRQIMTHDIRTAFTEVFGEDDRQLGLDLVYDVAHNIAKFETHFGRRLLVHRKGATRALPPGHPGNPPLYRQTGHPVLIPGSMGTCSWVLTGLPGIEETLCSANHGAGRVLSRREARRRIDEEAFRAAMRGVLLNARDYRDVVDEAPQVYKDVDAVVETLCAVGLARKVARLQPLAVIKGAGLED